MLYRATGINVGLDEEPGDLRALVSSHTGIAGESIEHAELRRRSVDARRKDRIRFVLSIDFTLRPGSGPVRAEGVRPVPEYTHENPPSLASPPARRPVVVGMGPAGLFAALTLAENGAPPLLVDMGSPLEERTREVAAFWEGGPLDPESNVQFGEGGAGTFSDGKLTTRIDDPRVRRVLEALVAHGAPEEVLYDAKPHVGTERIRRIVWSMRRKLISLGADIRFRARLDGVSLAGGAVHSVKINGEPFDTDTLILAPGNAARDTFSMLVCSGVEVVPKPFAVGARIEHPRPFIDRAQYGPYARHPRLGSAEYAMTFKSKRTGRSAYTFCMCPGGYVVNASSEPDGVVVNGMSYGNRDAEMSNSAVVVTVNRQDFPDGPLGGVEYQRGIENAAYRLTGGYRPPAQNVTAFMKGIPGGDLSGATVMPEPVPAYLPDCLPDYVCDTMMGAIERFDRMLKGFNHPKAVLTGVETRTSSPVRITRGPDMRSASARGLYPCGEGSGYAGGIISSAVDGMKAAENALRELHKMTV